MSMCFMFKNNEFFATSKRNLKTANIPNYHITEHSTPIAGTPL